MFGALYGLVIGLSLGFTHLLGMWSTQPLWVAAMPTAGVVALLGLGLPVAIRRALLGSARRHEAEGAEAVEPAVADDLRATAAFETALAGESTREHFFRLKRSPVAIQAFHDFFEQQEIEKPPAIALLSEHLQPRDETDIPFETRAYWRRRRVMRWATIVLVPLVLVVLPVAWMLPKFMRLELPLQSTVPMLLPFVAGPLIGVWAILHQRRPSRRAKPKFSPGRVQLLTKLGKEVSLTPGDALAVVYPVQARVWVDFHHANWPYLRSLDFQSIADPAYQEFLRCWTARTD